MKTPQNQTQTDAAYVDTVAKDFATSVLIVSLLANLAVFTSWLANAIAVA